MKTLQIALVLLTNALLLGLLLLVFLDGRNPYYFGGFLSSDSSRIYLLVLAAVGLITNGFFLAQLRRN